MKIERIVKKNNTNVLIEFDNNEKLILSLEVFVKSGLRKNDILSSDRFSLLINENKTYFVKQRAFRLLGRRLHSTTELRNKLLEKMYEKDLVDNVIADLKAKNYLNDEVFAVQFATEKFEQKKWSRKKIYSELLKRQINTQLINGILNSVFTDEDNYNNALVVAAKKLKSLMNRKTDKTVIKTKLITYLKMKGFNYSIIKMVCDELLKFSGEEN